MLAILSKNCVLMGDLDSYCLVCSAPVTGDVLGLEHIRSPEHNARLKLTVYFEKYKDDFIKKVNGLYFCEVCNKTFSTTAKVGIHVTEETHIKGIRRQLTRVGTSAVFQRDKLIEERAWNGLVEDTCVVCNVDFDDHSTHMSEHIHALNVVRSTVTIDDDNNIYRKVDGCYQCLTCNYIVSSTEISKHLDSEQHKAARFSLACTRNDADNSNIDERNEEKREQTKETEANVDDRKVTSNNNVDTNYVTDNPPFTEETAIKELTPVSEELETYAKEHYLFVTQDRFNLNCQICSEVVPGTMNHVKNHIAGKRHNAIIKWQAHIDKELNIMKMEKVLPQDYYRQILIVDSKYVIINNSFCFEFIHFFCLLDIGKIFCQLCDTEIARENRELHVASPSHDFKMRNAFVIVSLQEEFVRQFDYLYHCGFCGVFQKDFGDMLDHLTSPVHELQKLTKKEIFQSIMDEEILNHSSAQLIITDLR